MRHPTEGTLRRLLDEPAGVADVDRRHVADCAECLGTLVAVRADAALVETALAPSSQTGIDLGLAWQRMSAATTAPTLQPRLRRTGRARDLLRRPAAAVLAVAMVLGGASTAAANDWLQIFRTESLAAVRFTTADLLALPDLSSYGEIVFTEQADVHEVSDAATAAAESGLDVPIVDDLPRGVVGDPVYQVGRQVTATFTFSTERATQAAAAAGESLPPPPPGLDGSSVRLVAGPGVAQVWSSSSGAPALIVGRAVAPTAFSSGIPFETARDYFLSLPGLPDGVASQLRSFAADGTTLPLPVPVDEVMSRTEMVKGSPATVLETRDRTLAAVVWVDDGVLTFVAGSIDDDEALEVAWELR
ncbi:MAG TPA: hypothetical protein VNB94_04045 [Mycobacteriales bacterium]|nr:hypothetical protein [Mycobacteriales bacterium]